MVEILKPSNKSCSSLNFAQKSPLRQMSIFPGVELGGSKILYGWNITFIEMAKNTFRAQRCRNLKNCQMRPQNSFLQFSLKIQLFLKKWLNKKIFSIKFLIKKAIFIFCVRWPLTGCTVTQWDMLQTK